MNIELNVVPPGGGETNYTISIAENSYCMPKVGEYINFREGDKVSAFYVINVHHFYEKERIKFIAKNIVIEAEPVLIEERLGAEEHNKLCQSMNVTREYPETIY